jgi:hypothetical protein
MLVGTTSRVGLSLPLPAAAEGVAPCPSPDAPELGRVPPLLVAGLELQPAAVSSGSHSHTKDPFQVVRTPQA